MSVPLYAALVISQMGLLCSLLPKRSARDSRFPLKILSRSRSGSLPITSKPIPMRSGPALPLVAMLIPSVP